MAAEQVHECGLAGTVRSDDPEHLAGIEVKGDVTQSEQAAKLLASLGEPALAPLIARLDATDLPVRDLARRTLAQMGEGAVIALLPALKDPSPLRRAAAAALLGQLRSPAAALPLTVAIRDPDHDTSAAAREALVNLGEPAAPALVRSFTDSDPQTVLLAIQLLTRIGAPAIPELMRAIRAPDATVRRRAAETLVAIGEPAIPQLAAAIRDPDVQVRHQVVLSLARIPAPAGIRALLAASEDPDTSVRQYAGFALAKLPPAAASSLVQLLADPEPRFQRRVQQLLVDFGPTAALPLQLALEHDRAAVRLLAAEALVRLDAATSFSAIVRALDDRTLANDLATGLDDGRTAPLVARQLAQMQAASTSSQRNRIAVGLVKMGPPAMPALVAMLGKPDEVTAHDAARLLGQFAHPAAVLPLVRALRHDGRAYPAINIAAAEGLGDLRHLAAVPLLAQALRWNDWQLRREAMRALGKIAHPSAVPTLLEALKDDKPDVRVVTVEALAAIATPPAVNGLFQALNDGHADVRQAAVQALRRIRQLPATPPP